MSTALPNGWGKLDEHRRKEERRTDSGSSEKEDRRKSRGHDAVDDPVLEWDSLLESLGLSESSGFAGQEKHKHDNRVNEALQSNFVETVRQEYSGEGLVTVDTFHEEVIAVASSWEGIDDELSDVDYDPDEILTLRCYE